MTTMNMKNNFCDGHQHEMRKNWDEGRNHTYKIFTRWVGEGNIPNTVSYVELFMTTMNMKNNFCDVHQYEMRKSWDGGRNHTYKIFTRWVGEGNIPNTVSYVELFMTTMNMKNNFCDVHQHEMRKSWDGGRNHTYKIFTRWVGEGNIPNTVSYVELFMTTMKMKNNFCDGHQHEMQESRDGGGNNVYKIIQAGWRREILYENKISWN